MRRRWPGTLLAAALGAALPGQEDAEISCRVCHPGAVKGLLRSPHSVLNQRAELTGKVCASCHGDLAAHAEAVGRSLLPRPAVPAVTASRCATCHADHDHEPSRGRHLLAIIGSGAEPPPLPDADRIAALQQQTEDPAIDWSGFAELGYRFVHHSGSRRAFRTDLDLDPTFLLRDFEVRGRGSNTAPFDDLALRGHDLGDRRWDVGLSLTKADRFDVDSRFRRDSYRYDTSGDYHRVDRESNRWTTSFQSGGEDLQLFGTYSNLDAESFWLTQRIGNRNLPVQTVVNGVSSPRRLRSHDGELGARFEFGPLRLLVAGGFVDERTTDRWSYSQPATANPGFTESEDLTSGSHLDGPTGRIVATHDAGPVSFELSGVARELQRSLASNGVGAGFDTAAFADTTTANGSGRGRLLHLQLDSAIELNESLRLAFAARYRDYRERLQLTELQVRTVPSLNTVVTTTAAVDDETVQRLLDGDLSLEWSPTEDWDISVGYGIAREQLRVLSPGPADPQDFRRGHLDDDGFLAHLRWRFAEDWTVRAEGRDFATDGVRLNELTPERARLASTTLEWRRGPGQIAAFARHRHNDNDVSRHRLDAFATGISGSVTTDSLSLSAGYTFADTESRTRTNFYFDPDPAPQSTLVGFAGETHTWTAQLVLTPHEQLQVELGLALTHTIGSLAVDTADLHAGLLWRCTDDGAAGLEWRQVRYDDGDGLDDWSADLVFLFWRQEW